MGTRSLQLNRSKDQHPSISAQCGISPNPVMDVIAPTTSIPVVSAVESTQPSSDTQHATEFMMEKSKPELSCLNLNTPHSFSPANHLVYRNFTNAIHYCPCLPSMSPVDCELFKQVIHPYNASAFKSLLEKHNLTSTYPLLVKNLTSGFLLGELPQLKQSVIIRNHPSVNRFPDIMQEYIDTEIKNGQMSGPFLQEDVE
jgi:hypothetical protein